MASEHILLHRYCEGGGVFKAMAVYQHTIGKTGKYSKEAGDVGTELVM